MEQFEGVTREISDQMHACGATTICGDGMLLRTCEHGIRHSVGHLHRRLNLVGDMSDLVRRHESFAASGLVNFVRCDGCCEHWHEEPVADDARAREQKAFS